MKEVTLWTVQTAGAWSRLQKDGVLRADVRRVRREHRRAYEWLARQMEERLGCRPSAKALPLWAWFQCDGTTCRKPDLRSSGHLLKGESGVRIEFKVSDRLVLLSDFDLWHYVLNYWYLPESLKDAEDFEAELSRRGLSFYKTKPLRDRAFHAKITESWSRIFDLDWADRRRCIAHPRARKSIQASLWELRWDQVRDVRFFRAR
ncbi:MAG: DUF3841 domain-containing protein [candidate division WOR-3 bacterium]|nr:DUF3841 domain-containing protein [candidate division WOR-3 bacterium]